MGSIPITRSNPSQVQPKTAKTVCDHGRINKSGRSGARAWTCHLTHRRHHHRTDDAETQTYRTLLPSDNGAVGTVGLDFSQVLTSTATVTDKLLVEFGSADTLFTNALALTVKMSTKLALSVGYNIQDNSKPPAPLKRLDEFGTLNLVYSF